MIKPDFVFSQHSLQDYIDCPLRFKLRYVDQFAWPAAETDDQLANELHQRQGVEFHRLVQQMAAGLPEEMIESVIRDAQVLEWWHAFQIARSTFPIDLDAKDGWIRLAEHILTGGLAGHTLMAKYDLLMVRPGEKIMIFDWKTSRRPIASDLLESRVQTRVYRYLAVAAGNQWNDAQNFIANRVEMIYWQAADPMHPIYLPYSPALFELDRTYLSGLIQQIENEPADGYIKTDDLRRCRFCNYRSFCERGIIPGNQLEWDQDGEEGVDLTDVEPIEY
jgi:CRISPR/Cas system-associated exonuclease Cas4 (RecB family)